MGDDDSATGHTPPEGPQRGSLTQRWRAAYSKLPAAVQLIGLQLWLPVVFVILFCLCYIAAFHAPTVRSAPVAVVSPQSAQQVAQLRAATATAVDYREYGDVDQARAAVRDGAVVAAVALPRAPGGSATLYLASTHQFQAAQIAKSLFTPVFAAEHVPLRTVDLAPLPARDSFGMSAMYLMLAWCIGGYMVAMFIGMMGAPLLHRTRVAIILGGAVVLSLISNILAGPVIGAFAGHFWLFSLIAAGWIIAIGLAVNGLSYFVGRFVTLPALLVFVFLSIPSSGAAYPAWMLPAPFEELQPVVVGHGITEMIKRTAYGIGEPYWQGLVMMLCYAAVGVVLMVVGKPWRQRREARRILAGGTTMFADAQGAMREHGLRRREQVLEKYGPGVTEAEASEMEEEDRSVGPVFFNFGRSLSGMQESEDDSGGARGRHEK